MKQILILVTLTMALTLTAATQKGVGKNKLDPPTTTKAKLMQGPKIDFGTKVELPCTGAAGGDLASTVRVTNNTADTIPALTLVYVQTDNGKAQQALSTPVARRGTAIINAPKGNTPRSCQAWYFKK